MKKDKNSPAKKINLVDLAPAGFLSLDERGIITEINQAGAKLLNFNKTDLLQKRFSQFVAPNHKDVFGLYRKLVLETMSERSCEIKLIKKTGKSIYVQINSLAQPDPDGKINHFLSITDISKQKKIEAEVLELSKFPSENPFPMLRVAKDKTIIYANTAAKVLLIEGEQKTGEMMPKRWHKLIEEVFASGSLRQEIEMQEKDRTFLWMIVPILAGGYLNIYGTDITEHKKADEQLHQALAESQQREAEISALLECAKAVLQSSNFADTAQQIFNSCKVLIGAAAGYTALLTADGRENDVVFLESGDLECTVDPNQPMPIRGFRAEAYRTAKVVYDNDFAISEWMKYMPQGHVKLTKVLFAPLIIEGKAVGLLGLSNKGKDFTDKDANLAEAFAGLVAIALLNSRNVESLQQSEERFRSVVQTATDAIVTVNNQGAIVFWNEAAGITFGYSSKEVLGEPVTKLMPERFHAGHRAGLNHVIKGGETKIVGTTVGLTGLRKNGEEFPLELSLAKWDENNEVFFTGIIRDITERKLLVEAEAIRQSEARLAEAQRLAHLGNWEWKIATNEIFWSDEVYQIFGLSHEDFGATYEAFLASVHPDDKEFVKKSVDAALNEKKPYSIDHRIVRPNGEERVVHEQSKVVFDVTGRPIRMVGTIQDITERKQAEEALRQSETRLQEQKMVLEQKNIALKEILEQIGLEKKKIQDDVIANVDKLLVPTLKKLRMQPRPIEKQYIDILQDNLEDLTSSFGNRISEKRINLTPKEMELCNLIKSNLANKEISELLNITLRTVESHRKSIRKKLGIANQDINLTVYLQTL